MSEEVQTLDSWESVIIDFFENKVAQSELYKARKYIDDKEKEIKTEKDPKKLERLKKGKGDKEKSLLQLREDAPSTEISAWINKTSKTKIAVGKRIIKATHVLRFTHSSSLSDGLLLEEKTDDQVLTTSSLKKEVTHDLAHNNGALVTVSRFLALKLSGKLIFDLILSNDYSFFRPFAENQEQLDRWKKGFDNLIETRELKTTDKAKQIYFPTIKVDKKISLEDVEYHLITPLFSSSLAEELFTIVNNLKFGGEQKNIKKQINQNNDQSSKYHPKEKIEIPNLGVQKFGGTQPQNVSMLNKNRSWKANAKDKNTWGITYLINTEPPTWQSQLKPPINKESLFDYLSTTHIHESIQYLREFLLRFERIGLSIKDPKRRVWLDNQVKGNEENYFNSIIDEVLFYTSSIQSLPSGWSNNKEIKLKPEHQYFLDPYRDEETFQAKRKATDWQNMVCNDFARWLNRKLVGKEKVFTPQAEHTRMWKQLFAEVLREESEAIEMELNGRKLEETL